MLPVSELKHLNNGECADIYELDDRTVLKLAKPGWDRDMLYQEYLNGMLIGNSSIPAPKVYDFVETETRFGYTMEKLNDVTLLDLMWKRPWSVIAYAKKLAAIHAQIHSVKAPQELPLLVDKYRDFICSKNSISDAQKRLLLQDLEQLSAEGDPRICHGDFHPINVLVDKDRYFVIDWILAAQGNPEADVAGTYLITSIYSLISGGKNFFKNFASVVGGRMIAKTYLKEYLSITNMDKQKILRWIPVRAATYIDVGLPERLDRIFQKILEAQYRW